MVIHCGNLNAFLHFLQNFSISKGDNNARSPGSGMKHSDAVPQETMQRYV